MLGLFKKRKSFLGREQIKKRQKKTQRQMFRVSKERERHTHRQKREYFFLLFLSVLCVFCIARFVLHVLSALRSSILLTLLLSIARASKQECYSYFTNYYLLLSTNFLAISALRSIILLTLLLSIARTSKQEYYSYITNYLVALD